MIRIHVVGMNKINGIRTQQNRWLILNVCVGDKLIESKIKFGLDFDWGDHIIGILTHCFTLHDSNPHGWNEQNFSN